MLVNKNPHTICSHIFKKTNLLINFKLLNILTHVLFCVIMSW